MPWNRRSWWSILLGGEGQFGAHKRDLGMFNRRLWLGIAAMGALSSVLVARLVWLQLANHEHYTKFPNGMSEAENGGREEAGLSQGQCDGNK